MDFADFIQFVQTALIMSVSGLRMITLGSQELLCSFMYIRGAFMHIRGFLGAH